MLQSLPASFAIYYYEIMNKLVISLMNVSHANTHLATLWWRVLSAFIDELSISVKTLLLINFVIKWDSCKNDQVIVICVVVTTSKMISNSIAFKSFYFFIISGEAIGCFFNIGLVIITMVRLRSKACHNHRWLHSCFSNPWVTIYKLTDCCYLYKHRLTKRKCNVTYLSSLIENTV